MSDPSTADRAEPMPVEPRPTPAPATIPATPAETRRRGGAGPYLFAMLLFLCAGGGGYWAWLHPHTLSEQTDPRLPALEAEANNLADRVAGLEKEIPAAPSTESNVSDLAKRIDQIAGRQDALAARQEADAAGVQNRVEAVAAQDRSAMDAFSGKADGAASAANEKIDAAIAADKATIDSAAAADKSALDAVGARLDKLEQGAGQVEGMADKAARLGRLQAAQVALEDGAPLGELPGAPPALARFATLAPPTEAALRAGFPTIAAAARAASRPDTAGKPFLTRVLARMQQSVTVRRGDAVIVGDPAAGVISRAEALVASGDLPGAVTTLAALTGPAADAIKPWVDQAKSLLDARAALAALVAQG